MKVCYTKYGKNKKYFKYPVFKAKNNILYIT